MLEEIMDIVFLAFVMGLIYIPIVFVVNICMKFVYFRSFINPKLEISGYVSIIIVSLILCSGMLFLESYFKIPSYGIWFKITLGICYLIPVVVSYIWIKDKYSKMKENGEG